MSVHTCHAEDCDTPVPPRMFMCRYHWFMLPRSMRNAIWREYVPGQEQRKDPSEGYVRVATEAVKWLAARERSLDSGEDS